ncbi:MAG: hypothetical protein K6F00_00735 [Lachnospiraceae bacterium]|nr:hypothetical protein [Lachnospiraceae bacterium]
MIEAIKEFSKTLFYLLGYSITPNDEINNFLYNSSTVLLYVSAIGILLFIFLHPKIRQHKRSEDKFIFWECILVLFLIAVKIYQTLGNFLGEYEWFYYAWSVVYSLTDILYMIAILQWMMFVDYCLYHSREHIIQRYKNAIIPIIIYLGLEVIQWLSFNGTFDNAEKIILFLDISQLIKLFTELFYIGIALKLVIKHGKESRQPRFLRLDAFIIPFILGTLVRSYDASFMALGIILTYVSVAKRDRYIDNDTGFYNRYYLEYIGKYRDKKNYKGGNGILIYAPGHKKDMAELLTGLKPSESTVFLLDEDRFLLLSESLRGSAVNMAVMMITESSENMDDPFTPKIITVSRGIEESAEAFTTRLLNTSWETNVARKGVTS